MLYGQDRNALRAIFFRAWQRYRAAQPLEGVEAQIVALALRHPEYHPVLDDAEGHGDRDWHPEGGRENPFLHLSMHLALAEQLSINQPPGICQRFAELRDRLGDEHAAEHRAIDCLGEVLWQAQRTAATPDVASYLDCLARAGGTR